MRNYLYLGCGIAALVLAGWLYYVHPSHVPPAPKDLTRVFPKPLLEKATKAQLAVLRGEADLRLQEPATTPEAAPAACPARTGRRPARAAGGPGRLAGDPRHHGIRPWLHSRARRPTPPPSRSSTPGRRARCSPTARATWSCSRTSRSRCPPGARRSLSLPVAQTTAGAGVLEGRFTAARGRGYPTRSQPLVELLARKQNVSPASRRPPCSSSTTTRPWTWSPTSRACARPRWSAPTTSAFSVSPADLIAALTLIQEAGLDPAKSALMSEPQLKVMTLLNPESHAAAMEYLRAVRRDRVELLEEAAPRRRPGVAPLRFLRHRAVLSRRSPWRCSRAGCATPGVYRSYRLSAAWALALVNDPARATAARRRCGRNSRATPACGRRSTARSSTGPRTSGHPASHGGKTAGNPDHPARSGHAS